MTFCLCHNIHVYSLSILVADDVSSYMYFDIKQKVLSFDPVICSITFAYILSYEQSIFNFVKRITQTNKLLYNPYNKVTGSMSVCLFLFLISLSDESIRFFFTGQFLIGSGKVCKFILGKGTLPSRVKSPLEKSKPAKMGGSSSPSPLKGLQG